MFYLQTTTRSFKTCGLLTLTALQNSSAKKHDPSRKVMSGEKKPFYILANAGYYNYKSQDMILQI